jgi:hypothetical protein
VHGIGKYTKYDDQTAEASHCWLVKDWAKIIINYRPEIFQIKYVRCILMPYAVESRLLYLRSASIYCVADNFFAVYLIEAAWRFTVCLVKNFIAKYSSDIWFNNFHIVNAAAQVAGGKLSKFVGVDRMREFFWPTALKRLTSAPPKCSCCTCEKSCPTKSTLLSPTMASTPPISSQLEHHLAKSNELRYDSWYHRIVHWLIKSKNNLFKLQIQINYYRLC